MGLYRRLLNLGRGSKVYKDVDRELSFHIAEREDDLVAGGMSREEAHRTAVRRFGNYALQSERTRDMDVIGHFDSIAQDMRHAFRMMGRNVGFTAVAIITLAFGIGANTAIFSIVNGVLLQPLPYKDSDRLVRIVENIPASLSRDGKPSRTATINLSEFIDLQKRSQTLSLATYGAAERVTLLNGQEPVRLVRTSVTPSLFPMLGAQPIVGRLFNESDADRSASKTILLSYSAWHKYFSADPLVLNRIVTLNGTGYSVIGVMPDGFEFPDRYTDGWIPFVGTNPLGIQTRIAAIGRLRSGISTTVAASEINSILEENGNDAATHRNFAVLSIKDELVAPIRPALLVLIGAVGFVLLIACSNVANLLLARSTSRQGEIAIRTALGAARGRIIRQILTESVLLGIAGGIAGCTLAIGGVHALKTVGPGSIPRLGNISIDTTVLAFTLLVSVVTGILFGLVPSLQISRVDQMEIIKGSTGTKGVQKNRTRGLIVVAEIGMAVVLLIGGGLLIRSFLKLSDVSPGFNARNLLVFKVALPQDRSASLNTAATTRYLQGWGENVTEDFLARLQSLPGVVSVGFANILPLQTGEPFVFRKELRGLPTQVQESPEFRAVSRDYVPTMGLRLLAGRNFQDSDGAGRPLVVIVDQAIVRRYFNGQNPIGKSMTMGNAGAEIIGIVDDVRERGLDLEPRPHIYCEVRQVGGAMGYGLALNWANFILRSNREPMSLIPDVRAIVRQTVPEATLDLNVASMEDLVSNSVARPRFYALLLTIFAVVAVLLATIGIYGLTTYSVTQRTREIGIRMALGAKPRAVLALIVRDSLSLAVIGICIGIAGALAVTRYLVGMLFGLTPLDPGTFVAAPSVFAFIALFGSYVAARRATKVDPLVALRHE